MLIVFGTHGSPGATSIAYLLSYFWAERFRSSLLVEADPLGGVLATMLNLDPAKGMPTLVTDNNPNASIKNHTQRVEGVKNEMDVLVNSNSIKGAWDSMSLFSAPVMDKLIAVAKETPVVVDGGKIFHSSPSLKFMVPKATVAIVVRDAFLPGLPALRYLKTLSNAISDLNVGIIAVGEAIWEGEEYTRVSGLNFFGRLEEHPDGYLDLLSVGRLYKNRVEKSFYESARALSDGMIDILRGKTNTRTLAST